MSLFHGCDPSMNYAVVSVPPAHIQVTTASGCTQQYKTPYSDLSEFQCRFRVWHFACTSHGVDIIRCHVAHYDVWEGRGEEREDAKRRKQQIASSHVKLDKLTLRDVVFCYPAYHTLYSAAIKYKTSWPLVVSRNAKLCTRVKHVCSLRAHAHSFISF